MPDASSGGIAEPAMKAAVLHKVGEPFVIEQVGRPSPRPTDVLVEVRACGVVPNYLKVIEEIEKFDFVKRPRLPAIYGLDVAGVIAEKGSQVHGLEVGDRVYVNPARTCGGCRPCRTGNSGGCEYWTLAGYFGSKPKSQQMFDDYPFGGFCEFMTAPQSSIVVIPENMSFEEAARWGYFGTGYAGLQRGKLTPGKTLLINGITGTLGLGAALFGLALGARKIYGVGRNRDLLARLKAIAPDRIEVLSTLDNPDVAAWVKSLTGGVGADIVLDALPTDTPPDAFVSALGGLANAGKHVNVGGVTDIVPIHVISHMNDDHDLCGSMWFSTKQGQEMADLVEAGMVNLSVLDHEVYKLEDVNEVLRTITARNGGFSNFVIRP